MIFTLHIASWRHLCKYGKCGKWAWPNGRTRRSGQLWAALAGKVERLQCDQAQRVVKKEWSGVARSGLPGQAKGIWPLVLSLSEQWSFLSIYCASVTPVSCCGCILSTF